MKRATIFTTILVAIAFTRAWATIINIPDDYPSIQEGIDASTDGDTVLVQPGQYVENINFNGHNIVLGSLFLTTGDTAYISTTIVDGDWTGTVMFFDSGEDSSAVVVGFTIQAGSPGGIYCRDSSPTIKSNIVTSNRGMDCGAGILCERSSPLIIYNTISNNSAFG